MDSLVGKIALGTVQFGLDYGIANAQGRVPYLEVCQIIKAAIEAGVSTLDTAVAYGDSETVLGRVGCKNYSVITKLPEVPLNEPRPNLWIEKQISEALSRLKIAQLDGLLLHRPEQLNSPIGEKLYKALCASKERGEVKRIGISIYEPQEFGCLSADYKFDLIQVPFNPFDQRILTTGLLERLSDSGAGVHLRSIFLQGLLLMRQHERPSKFLLWQEIFKHWDSWLVETGQSALEACLNHALNVPGAEKVVVGINSLEQFYQIIEAINKLGPNYRFEPIIEDPRILNPSKWGDL